MKRSLRNYLKKEFKQEMKDDLKKELKKKRIMNSPFAYLFTNATQ